jgi:predicted metal-binding membrane protein
MGGMAMPGGWTMSMAWMRMPGHTWSAAATSFLGMWVVVMVPMMLPVLVPMVRSYRAALTTASTTRRRWLTVIVATGYFVVWTAIGAVAFPLGATLAAAEMQMSVLARAVPLAVGVVVLIAGVVQLTAWKAQNLACCRETPGAGETLPADAMTALRQGVRLGLICARCCANLMLVLLVVGMMDVTAMAVVTAAIIGERLAPTGERVARITGGVVIAAGLALIALA